MKTWLKGGLIGLLIALIQPIILFYAFEYNYSLIDLFSKIPLLGFYVNLWKIASWGWGTFGFGILVLIFIIIFFIIGALIGLIIQKVKK